MKKTYVLLLILLLVSSVSSVSAKIIKHTIKNGETLYVIAHANHTTIEEVRKANGLKKGERLKLGRVLKVPKNTYFPNKNNKKISSKIIKHKIKNGETLYSIAHANHTTIEEVRKANGFKKGERLKLGRVLKVPKNTYFPNKKKNTKKFTKKASKKLHKKFVLFDTKTKKTKLKLKKYTKAKKKRSRGFSLSDIFSIGRSSRLKGKHIISLAKTKLGRRYVWGATGVRNTFDCSGFTKYVYSKNGIKLPRRAIAQSKYGKYISRKNLKKGDLIFFDTSRRHKGYVNHVGIYIGNGKFIHASSAKKKVVITRLQNFYAKRYRGARRPS